MRCRGLLKGIKMTQKINLMLVTPAEGQQQKTASPANKHKRTNKITGTRVHTIYHSMGAM